MSETKNCFVKLSEVKLHTAKYPEKITTMEVNISGTPSLPEILAMMKEINTLSEAIKGDYISITDMTKLDINKFIRSIILHGMESTYKSLLSVKNAAVLSFVVLGDNQEEQGYLSKSLENINETSTSKGENYKFKYVFVKSKEEIPEIAESLLS